MDWFHFYQQSPNTQIGLLRGWFTKKRVKKLRDEYGVPIWVQFIQRKMWHVLAEILAQDSERNEIFWRDALGRGWCHYCVYHSVPHALAADGMRKLGEGWKDKDNFGVAPYDIFPAPPLAQMMAWRLWRESLLQGNDGVDSIYQRNKDFFTHLAKEAKTAEHHDTARVWLFWTQASAFDNTDHT